MSQTIPFVYNSPHSGRIYPPEFIAQSRLEGIAIRLSEDHYVDELFGSAVAPAGAAHRSPCSRRRCAEWCRAR
ncbi:N-formylglutamate amidohydrolase, partial [Rhizobium ruizarguesonis]